MPSNHGRWRESAVVVALCGLVALAPARLWAQGETGSIGGKVVDNAGMPLVGVQVLVDNTDKGTVTKANGVYVIEVAPAGAHSVRVRMIGYRTMAESVMVVAGQRVTQDFTLTSDPLHLA